MIDLNPNREHNLWLMLQAHSEKTSIFFEKNLKEFIASVVRKMVKKTVGHNVFDPLFLQPSHKSGPQCIWCIIKDNNNSINKKNYY
jgi:hypothetical protein